MTPGELAIHDALVHAGYVVLRNGWPDFLVQSPNRSIFALEWKEIGTRDSVRPHQEQMHELLALAGIPTLVAGSIADVFSVLPRRGNV